MNTNPYSPPKAVEQEKLRSTAKSRPVPWKLIAARWEWLRLPYNFIVGAAGMVFVLFHPSEAIQRIDEILLYAVGANVFYLLGPVGEMYLNWIIDAGEDRFLPAWIIFLVRSSLPTAFLFLAGAGFSFVLTLVLVIELPSPP